MSDDAERTRSTGNACLQLFGRDLGELRGAVLALRVQLGQSEPGLGSSADGKGEEGIDGSFDRAGIPVHLGE